MSSLLDPLESREDRIRTYQRLAGEAAARGGDATRNLKRYLALNDLFYLMTVLLKRRDLNKDWLFDRCQEVQASPNGHLDLWAREHFKSSIITFGLTIQDILRDPEITIGLFSHTRPNAKMFLRQIKGELERNADLKALFGDVIWENPTRDAPKWSEDEGLIVRRDGNPKEATLEARGLVDGQPVGKHYKLRVYDDVIEKSAVTSPDMIRKVTEAWELSLALGTDGGWSRYIGTRYHFNDTYAEMMRRGSVKPRIYPATADGAMDGEPVLMTRTELAQRRRDWGSFTFSAQMLQDPTADRKQGFRAEWIQHYEGHNDGAGLNKYLLVDPASEKKRESDYTTMGVIGVGADRNYYLLDMIRDRLNLRERADALFSLHRRWRPTGVGYEKYGMQCDIEYIQERQADSNYRFEITPLGGQMAKPDRIRRMIPIFESNRFYLPEHLMKTDYEGRLVDLVQSFVEEEYKPFPVALHDDMFDMISRIEDSDMNVIWPKDAPQEDRYAKRKPARRNRSWMAA